MTAITPPAPPEQGTAPTPPSAPRRNGAAKPVAIVTIAVGAVLLLGAAASAVASTVLGASSGSQTLTADADGVERLEVDTSEGDVRVEFGDVDEAVLEVTGRVEGSWRLERAGSTLTLDSPETMFDWTWGGNTRATLTLPEGLATAGLDADLSLDAGSLTTAADFGAVAAEVDAGALRLDGSARSLDLSIDAGRADVDLADVGDATFDVSAGMVVAELSGDAPRRIGVEVSAGSVELTVPDGSYDVTEDVSAGSIDNRLETSTSASRQIGVTVSAGSVTLRSAG
ncbi:hypothetical protein [Herbiconiux sp. L3-i23]|uniref:hypothetical protein n=1 Tax=Herbiconiux sp. L3-i23 TaxID=2905871 RepID=UPI00206E5B62|nr:hypothetical protein [Herbiconiux sp. L3-i23]BDI23297.1 hypothetical protein L3i23_20730 [Herbiconiux sp. L3-i23]